MTLSVPLWYWRCLRMSKDVSHHCSSSRFWAGFASRAWVAFSGLFLSALPGFSEGFCGYYPNELPSPYIRYALSGKILSRTLILDDGIEYPCDPRLVKYKDMTSLACGPLTLSWGKPFEVACLSRYCISSTSLATAYVLTDKNKTVFNLGVNNKDHNYSYSSDSSRVYSSDAVVSTEVEKWGLRDTDRTIRLRTVSECPVQHLPRPAL